MVFVLSESRRKKIQILWRNKITFRNIHSSEQLPNLVRLKCSAKKGQLTVNNEWFPENREF
jgi:hypothetical protein